MKYFEDSNLSLTQRLRKIAILGQAPSSIAMALPIPCPAPVTSATFPFRKPSFHIILILQSSLLIAVSSQTFHLFGTVAKLHLDFLFKVPNSFSPQFVANFWHPGTPTALSTHRPQIKLCPKQSSRRQKRGILTDPQYPTILQISLADFA